MCLLVACCCLGAGCHNVVLEVSGRFRVALPGRVHKPAAFGGFLVAFGGFPVALGGFLVAAGGFLIAPGGFPVAPGGFPVAPGGFLIELGGFQDKVLPSVYSQLNLLALG